jgi:hypothetical protein
MKGTIFGGATVKAYGYLRVSGKSQVDGDGLIRQEQTMTIMRQLTASRSRGSSARKGSLERRKTGAPWPR